MDPNKMKILKENIEEIIKDEDKIITFKWLSKRFSLHVQQAKELISNYAIEQADNLLITHVIIGKKDDKISCEIVPISDLDAVRSSFDKVISEHVYSIQSKSIPLNSVALYLVDTDKLETKYKGVIKCNESTERKARSIISVSSEPKVVSQSSFGKKPVNKTSAISSMFQKTKETNGIITKENKTSDIHKENAIVKKDENSSIKKEHIKPEEHNKAKNSPKGLASFFAKQSTLQQKKIEVKSPAKKETRIDDEEVSIEKSPENNKTETKVESKIKLQEKNKKPLTNSKKKSTKSKKRTKEIDSDDLPAEKRRKRIVQLCDSDSSDDEIFGKEESSPKRLVISDDDDEIVPPTPEVNLAPKNKKRKVVEKIFMDDEGFMVTKKEFVYESPSESEENKEEEKEEEKKEEKNHAPEPVLKKAVLKSAEKSKRSSPKKQATLMSFFKKK